MQIGSLDVEILPRGLVNFALFDDVVSTLFIVVVAMSMVVVIVYMAPLVFVFMLVVMVVVAVVMIVTVGVTVSMAMSRALLTTDVHMTSFARMQNLDLNAVEDA